MSSSSSFTGKYLFCNEIVPEQCASFQKVQSHRMLQDWVSCQANFSTHRAVCTQCQHCTRAPTSHPASTWVRTWQLSAGALLICSNQQFIGWQKQKLCTMQKVLVDLLSVCCRQISKSLRLPCYFTRCTRYRCLLLGSSLTDSVSCHQQDVFEVCWQLRIQMSELLEQH